MCGCLAIGVGGERGGCLKAVGFFCCRCAGEREALGTCAGTLLQPLQEGEVGHDTGDARANDTADSLTVAATLGAAYAPDGFEIVFQYLFLMS